MFRLQAARVRSFGEGDDHDSALIGLHRALSTVVIRWVGVLRMPTQELRAVHAGSAQQELVDRDSPVGIARARQPIRVVGSVAIQLVAFTCCALCCGVLLGPRMPANGTTWAAAKPRSTRRMVTCGQ